MQLVCSLAWASPLPRAAGLAVLAAAVLAAATLAHPDCFWTCVTRLPGDPMTIVSNVLAIILHTFIYSFDFIQSPSGMLVICLLLVGSRRFSSMTRLPRSSVLSAIWNSARLP